MLVVIIGVLVGLEIPLLMRILKDRFDFKDVVAHVLTFDYLGALGASLLFPLVLVPQLGLVRSALLFGLINAGVALWTTRLLEAHTPRARLPSGVGGGRDRRARRRLDLVAIAVHRARRDNLYADDVVLSRETRRISGSC